MENDKVILWDLMKTYLSLNQHVYEMLHSIKLKDDEVFILTPHTQESVDHMATILKGCEDEEEYEYFAKLLIGAMETADYAAQIAALLAGLDYRTIKENRSKENANDLEPLIKEQE